MAFQQQLVLFIMAFFMSLSTYEHQVIALWEPPHTSPVAKVSKHTDSTKPLYSVQVISKYVRTYFFYTNFLIDIDTPFIWYNCILKWDMNPNSCPGNTICASPISCEQHQCTDIRTSSSYNQYSSSCPPATNSSMTLPSWSGCTCPVSIVDPVNGSCAEALLNSAELFFNEPYMYGFYPNGACAPSSSFDTFLANVSSVMALSSNTFLSYISDPYPSLYSLCFPSSVSNTGVFFLGSSSYYFSPNSDVDVRSYLTYTPLLKYPDSFGYFIGVKSIVIKKRAITVSANTTTKLSTLEPYTCFD
ncbi:uncharacterized protein [Rutidosis leptorrhynchoides]|uniref:uncharacterized protein n=1 Tax=Rutidosis leptorrhynchoides TaxID=125765 RepID=UPI003A99B881